MSTFVNELLESDILQQHITAVIVPRGRERYLTIMSAIKKYLYPLGAVVSPNPASTTLTGGYCVWLKLPGSLKAVDVCQRAAETQMLTLGCGDVFEVPGGKSSSSQTDLRQRVRLCFMWEDEARLTSGIERLGNVIREMLLD